MILRAATAFLVLGIVYAGFVVAAERPSGKRTPDRSLRSTTGPRALPIDVSPLRMRVETREGVLVVYDAAAPPEADEGCSGYIGYWLSAGDKTQYLFPAVLQAEGDLGTVLLALERDLGVDLEALADTDDRVDGALRASSQAPNEEIVWEPATLRRAVEIMRFDPEIDPDLNEPGGDQTAAPPPCDGCAAGVGPPRNCGSPGGLAREAFAVAAGCCPPPGPPPGGGGGGGGGPPPSCVCCPVAVASGAEGSDSSPNGMGSVAVNCCGPDGACDDGNPCTENDNCNRPDQCPSLPAFTCCGRPKVCADDGNVCTWDHCVNGGCVNTPRNCDDDNKCTNDSCNPSTGACVYQPKNCNDGEVCTADRCNLSTGDCENPQSCHDPDRPKCCPAGSGFSCCTSDGVCCTNPDHCCNNGETCCPGGLECCALNQTCCNGHCGLKGACCNFDTGSCSELTHLCCDQQGGSYRGDGTTCTPADLCRPICENCHAVNMTFYECRHETNDPSEPCSLTQCTQNEMISASCDAFPNRKGPPKCNTFDTGVPGEVIQIRFTLPLPTVCETTNPGGFHLWTNTFSGCGTDCIGKPWTVRCDTGPCGGAEVFRTPRGTKHTCGCP